MDEILIQLIGQYGFPAAMCLWFMWRTDAIISKNTEALDRLAQNISQCPKKVNT